MELESEEVNKRIERMPTSSIDDWAAWAIRSGYSELFVKKVRNIFETKSAVLPTGLAIEESLVQAKEELPSSGITPYVFKCFIFMHPTLWYGGSIILGYTLSIFTVFLGSFSFIPFILGAGLGLYILMLERKCYKIRYKTRFHGIVIIVISFFGYFYQLIFFVILKML